MIHFVLCLQAKVDRLTLPTRTSPSQSTVAPNLTMTKPATTGLLNTQSSHGKCMQSEGHSIHRSQTEEPQAGTGQS